MLVAGGQRKNQSTRGNKYAKAYLFPLEILGDAVKKEEAAKIIIKCAQEYEIMFSPHTRGDTTHIAIKDYSFHVVYAIIKEREFASCAADSLHLLADEAI